MYTKDYYLLKGTIPHHTLGTSTYTYNTPALTKVSTLPALINATFVLSSHTSMILDEC